MSPEDQPNGLIVPNATRKYLTLCPSTANAIFDTTSTTTPGYALAEDDLLRDLLYDEDFILPGKLTHFFFPRSTDL